MNFTWLWSWRRRFFRRGAARTIDHDDAGKRAAVEALAAANRRDPAVNRMVQKLNDISARNGLGEAFVAAMRERGNR